MKTPPIAYTYLSWGQAGSTSTTSRIVDVALSALVYLMRALSYLHQHSPKIFKPVFVLAASAIGKLFILVAQNKTFSKPPERPKEVPPPHQSFKADLIAYNSGHESWAMKKAMIGSAKQSIECSFNFAGGPYLSEFLAICINRLQNSDVKIHLMLEDIISEKKDLEALAEIKKKYPDRFFYLVAKKKRAEGSLIGTEENHSKLLIVDGKYFMLGSTGVHETFCGPPIEYTPENVAKHRTTLPVARHEDSDIAGAAKDSVAAVMRYEFFNLYAVWNKRLNGKEKSLYFNVDPTKADCPAFEKHTKVRRDNKIRFLVSGPEHRGNNPIENCYESMITNAQKIIHIANLAFYLPEKIRSSLKASKALKVGYFEGVGERTLSMSYISKLGIHTQNRKDYDCLDLVYEWVDPLSLYHRKVMVIDEKHTIIGSYNLGVKSSMYDYECALVIEDSPEVANDFLSHITVDSSNVQQKQKKVKHSQLPSILYRKVVSPIMG